MYGAVAYSLPIPASEFAIPEQQEIAQVVERDFARAKLAEQLGLRPDKIALRKEMLASWPAAGAFID